MPTFTQTDIETNTEALMENFGQLQVVLLRISIGQSQPCLLPDDLLHRLIVRRGFEQAISMGSGFNNVLHSLRRRPWLVWRHRLRLAKLYRWVFGVGI